VILLLGADGQLGRELARSLVTLGPLTQASRTGTVRGFGGDDAGKTELVHAPGIVRNAVAATGAVAIGEREDGGTARVRIDLAEIAAIGGSLDALAPRIIVNAAAYTAVDRAEDDGERADAVNHRAVAAVADWSARNDALLVHYSTDYVFAGDASQPYPEQAATGPSSSYGRSKLAGEVALRASGCASLLLRTAWVYAAHGQNFARTLLRAAASGKALRVVADQIGTPTSARFIAESSIRRRDCSALT